MPNLDDSISPPTGTGGRLEAMLGRALGVDDAPLPPLEPADNPASSAGRPSSHRDRGVSVVGRERGAGARPPPRSS